MVMGGVRLLICLAFLGRVHSLSSVKSTTKRQIVSDNPGKPGSSGRSISIGEEIQDSQSVSQLLSVASRLWLPSDPNLASHLRTQSVHHEKRQRWSAQLLEKLSHSMDPTLYLWDDERLARAILAAAIPFHHESSSKGQQLKEGRSIQQAIKGLHKMIAVTRPPALPSSISLGLSKLIERANSLSFDVSLSTAVEMRWAARGILARQEKSLDLPQLDERVQHLPFDILPLGIADWSALLDDHDPVSTLCREIPFQRDVIVTRSGAKVSERRGTAWLAAEGIGALAYSGKLMPPRPIPSRVEQIFRAVEDTLWDNSSVPPEFSFDCALCNHYPDAEAACKFHTDPEHGTMWERHT